MRTNQSDGTVVDAVTIAGSNALVFDGSTTWANSAVVNTVNNIDITLPSSLQGDALYTVTVTNPSTESDVTVVLKSKETFGGTARYPELTRFGVGKSNTDGKTVIVQGWMLGEGGRLTLSNDTAIGAAGAFTAYVRVRKV